MKKIKEEDLILYLYNELPDKLKANVEKALSEDITLQERLDTLKRTLKQLDKIKLKSPAKKSIKAILKHAHDSDKKN